MKTLVKIILIINGALLLLGGILLGLGLLLGGKTSFGFDWKNSNFQEAKYVDKEIDLDDFDEMEINLSSLELIIEESDKIDDVKSALQEYEQILNLFPEL